MKSKLIFEVIGTNSLSTPDSPSLDTYLRIFIPALKEPLTTTTEPRATHFHLIKIPHSLTSVEISLCAPRINFPIEFLLTLLFLFARATSCVFFFAFRPRDLVAVVVFSVVMMPPRARPGDRQNAKLSSA